MEQEAAQPVDSAPEEGNATRCRHEKLGIRSRSSILGRAASSESLKTSFNHLWQALRRVFGRFLVYDEVFC